MSGGPGLESETVKLAGINGLKYPLQGIDALHLLTGTKKKHYGTF